MAFMPADVFLGGRNFSKVFMSGKLRSRWRLWALLLALAAGAALTTWHFAPRYLYSSFGYLALSEVKGGATPAQKQNILSGLHGQKGLVAWSSSRSGNHEIYILDLADLSLHQLTKNNFVDFFPRFSPDGDRIAFARSQKPWVSERQYDLWDVYVLSLKDGSERLAAKDGNFPLWVDRDKISFRRKDEVVVKDLTTGQEKVILPRQGPPGALEVTTPELSPTDPNLLAVTFRGKIEGVFVADLARQKFTKTGEGCEITWFPDGKRLLWVDNGGNGGTQLFAAEAPAGKPAVFMDLPGKFSHEYFPRLSRDGKWLVWAASAGEHEHDIADYEIFLWNTSQAWDQALRLTYNPGNDRWPDIFVRE